MNRQKCRSAVPPSRSGLVLAFFAYVLLSPQFRPSGRDLITGCGLLYHSVSNRNLVNRKIRVSRVAIIIPRFKTEFF